MYLFTRYEFFEVLFLVADRISVFTSIDDVSIRESRCDFHFFAARGAVSAVNLIRMRGWCYLQYVLTIWRVIEYFVCFKKAVTGSVRKQAMIELHFLEYL